MNGHAHRKTERIHNNVLLSALDLLVPVHATLATDMMGGLDASGVNGPDTRAFLPTESPSTGM